MQYLIPGYKKPLILDTIILDLNGTIGIDGILIIGVEDKIGSLKELGRNVLLCSGDTQGTAATIAKKLGATLYNCKDQKDKEKIIKKHNAKHCVAIGNGNIDLKLLKKCKLSIAVIQAEGCYGPLLMHSDIVCTQVIDALDMLLLPKRLIATLRK